MAQANTAQDGGLSLALDTMEPLHWVGVVLALITGVIHVFLGLSFGPVFHVAGVGFFLGIVVILLDVRRRLFYVLGSLWTLGQIVLWLLSDPGFGPLGIVDKVAQVLFIVVLVVLFQREG